MNQSINTDSKNIKEPQQKYRLGTVSIKILGGLNRFYRRLTSPIVSIIPYYVAASRTGPVITRTMSPWSTGGSEHARTYDNMRNVYENCTTICYEKNSVHFGRSYGEIFKLFKNLVGSPRQCTRYGDMLREQPT